MKKKIFWKAYWVVVAVGIVLVTSLLIVLHAFLSSYEGAQPFHKMDEILPLFQEAKLTELLPYEEATYEEKDVAAITKAFERSIEGKEVTYNIDYSKNTADNPAYSVLVDKKAIATVYLEADEKRGSFDSKSWHLLKVTGLVNKLNDVTITAPSSYLVKYDGLELTADQQVSTEELADKEHFGDYATSFPQMVTYKVSNVYIEPELQCFDGDGNEISLIEGDFPNYSIALCPSTFPEEKRSDLDTFVAHYVKYCMGDEDFSEVKGYFLEGTSTYSRMTEVASISMYAGRHSRIEISEVDVSDYIEYNEEAYRATYEFTYTLYHGDKTRENPTILNCYYVKTNGKWKIVEMTINANRKE